MSSLKGKVVLITGASAGIGAALARECVTQGADVVLTARREERLQSLAEELTKSGGLALPLRCDVNEDGAIERVVQTVHETWDRQIDVVIANAGFGVEGRFQKLDVSDYKRQFETNVFGVLRTIQDTLPDLLARKGHAAIVGSVAAYAGLPGTSAYSASKSAVAMLSRVLDAELRQEGVSVTLLSPGFVASEIRQIDNQGVLHEDAKDPVPSWLVMPAEKAARQMLKAIMKRKSEQIITFHGKILRFLVRYTPWLYHLIQRRAGLQKRRPNPPESV